MFRDTAPAKINLFLHIRGRRADGYHELDSLVSFASIADDMTFAIADTISLAIGGPFAAAIAEEADNLVFKAAQAFAATFPGTRNGHFTLTKNLPVASGIGGGSSDAACTLRLLALANEIPLDDSRLMACACTLGADVPVCLERLPRIMRGIGHALEAPVIGRAHPVLLINPGVEVETKAVFARLCLNMGEAFSPSHSPESTARDGAFRFLQSTRNDLEGPAIAIAPVIGHVLIALRATSGCQFARMSGSGATCFGIFVTLPEAKRAAELIQAANPHWWIAAGQITLPD